MHFLQSKRATGDRLELKSALSTPARTDRTARTLVVSPSRLAGGCYALRSHISVCRGSPADSVHIGSVCLKSENEFNPGYACAVKRHWASAGATPARELVRSTR